MISRSIEMERQDRQGRRVSERVVISPGEPGRILLEAVTMGYPIEVALRYLGSKKRAAISVGTAFAILGVTLGVAALARGSTVGAVGAEAAGLTTRAAGRRAGGGAAGLGGGGAASKRTTAASTASTGWRAVRSICLQSMRI